MIRLPILPMEKTAKLTPLRVIAPLYEKFTAYLAKKLTFATPGPSTQVMGQLRARVSYFFL